MPRTLLLVCLLAPITACEWFEPRNQTPPARPATLMVETPPALDWGGTGILRVILANDTEDIAEGGIVEVHVPDWLEFGRVEPAGTAVIVVSGEDETRLAYQLTDSLPPGERRIVIQHLRVRQQPPAAEPVDTMETVELAPTNRIVRARLLDRSGAPAGAEVHATLHFAGAGAPPAELPAGARPPGDGARRDTAAGPVVRDTARPREPRDTVPD